MKKLFILLGLIISLFCQAKANAIAPSLADMTKNFQATEKEKAAGAVILRRDIQSLITSDGKAKNKTYVAIKLLNEKAVDDYSQLEIAYNAYYETLTLDFARIIQADGQTRNIEKDAQQVQSGNGDQFYDNRKQLKFSLPGLAPGSIIEYQYRYNSIKPIIKDAWTQIHRFHYIQNIPRTGWIRIDPVRVSRLHLELPESMPLDFNAYQVKSTHTKTKSDYGYSYLWEETALPEIKIEKNMPSLYSGILPYLEISSLNKWAEIDAWLKDAIQPTLAINPAIHEQAEFFNDPKLSLEQKVKAVFHFVQKEIRYVYAHVNSNGFTPHKAAEVLRNNYGDCKDQTILIVSLLNAMGIEAYPALINASSSLPINPKLPLLSFDHMIVHVPALRNYQWLDTSGETGMFPGISHFLDENYALVLNGKGGQLRQLPSTDPNKNKVSYTANFSASDDSGMNLDLSFHFSGFFDAYFRAWYKHAQNKENDRHQFLKNFYEQFEIKTSSVSDVEDLSIPFTLKARLFHAGNFDKNKFQIASNVALLLKNFTDILKLPIPKNRIHAYKNNVGYQLSSITRFTPPDNHYKPYVVKIGANYDNANFSLKHQSIEKDDNVAIHINFKLGQALIEKKDYANFYQTIDNATKQSESIVLYALTTPANAKPIATISPAIEGNEFEQLLYKARNALNNADYEHARELAKKGQELNDQHPEIYYILGLASGFLDDYDNADQFLKKAEELGYRP